MKDRKFYIQFSLLLTLIVVALYVLNFVSFKKKRVKKAPLLITLEELECDVGKFNFIKKVKKSKVKVVVVEKIVEKKVFVQKDEKKEPTKKQNIVISSKKVAKTINKFKLLEKKFYKTSDYKIALKLSRLYYTSREYKKALKWSMVANELNKKDDESWLLFAKSKLKLGEKEIARRALTSYQQIYKSNRVKKLLKRISS